MAAVALSRYMSTICREPCSALMLALLLCCTRLPQTTARIQPNPLRGLAQVEPAAIVSTPTIDPTVPPVASAQAAAVAAAAAVPGPALVTGDAVTNAADLVAPPTAAAVPAQPAAESTGTVETMHIYKRTPKLFLYAWCGVSYEQQAAAPQGDNTDYIATIDATPDSPQYGQILSVASTPYAGTEAHHCNVDKSGKWLGAGGLLAFAKRDTPDIYMFDLSNPAEPKYTHGYTSTSGSCMDEFVAAATGGFLVSSMCGRDGHPGGGVVRIPDPSRTRMYEYNGGMDTPEEKASFASHGIDVDYVSRRMVTADYLDVVSAVKQPNGTPQPNLGLLHTAHVWDIDHMKVLKSVDLTGITDGLMESRFSGRTGLFWVSGGLGKLHLIDTRTFKVTPNVYCLGEDCADVKGTCLTTQVFDGPRGKRMLVTSMSLAQMRLVDVSNPRKLKTLDTYQLPEGAGAHVVKFDTNTWTAAVATYLLNINGPIDTVEAIKFPSDQSVRLFRINLRKDKIVPQDPVIDFKTAMAAKGSSNCHGLAFNYQYV